MPTRLRRAQIFEALLGVEDRRGHRHGLLDPHVGAVEVAALAVGRWWWRRGAAAERGGDHQR
jgi:hypothetical protein